MEMLVNLMDAVIKLTWGFNPIKYLLSAQYREDFHSRSGMSLGMTLAAFTIGVLILVCLLAAIVLVVQHGFQSTRR